MPPDRTSTVRGAKANSPSVFVIISPQPEGFEIEDSRRDRKDCSRCPRFRSPSSASESLLIASSARVAISDHLGEQRVVIGRHLDAGLDPAVDSHAFGEFHARRRPGAGPEILRRIFGVDARLDGAPFALQTLLAAAARIRRRPGAPSIRRDRRRRPPRSRNVRPAGAC